MSCAFFEHKKCVFWITDKPVIRRKLAQYKKYFTCSEFSAYFPCLKAWKILCKKISELVKYFLYCTRNCLITITYLFPANLDYESSLCQSDIHIERNILYMWLLLLLVPVVLGLSVKCCHVWSLLSLYFESCENVRYEIYLNPVIKVVFFSWTHVQWVADPTVISILFWGSQSKVTLIAVDCVALQW